MGGWGGHQRLEKRPRAQTQKCMCSKLNLTKCSCHRTMGVGTQESIRCRMTGVGTVFVGSVSESNMTGHFVGMCSEGS